MTLLPRRPFLRAYQVTSGRRLLTAFDQLNHSQWWTQNELLDLQQQKLHRLLTHAARRVPYYRRLFRQAGFTPDSVLHNPEAIREIPLLTKAQVRDHFDDLRTGGPPGKQSRSLQTSGSSGTPLEFLQDSNCRDFVTAEILRHLGWAGWRLNDGCAFLLGARAHEPQDSSLRSRLMDWVLNRFVMNANTLSHQRLASFTDQVRRRRPRFLFAYPWSAIQFAEHVRDVGMEDIRFESVILGGETLQPFHRQKIEKTFSCRVFDRYGASETGGLACECQAHEGLHVGLENIHLEILVGDRPAEPGESGEVVVTNLNNHVMPFIRYRLEDLAAWRPPALCPCGRSHPRLRMVRGRQIDLLRTRDGQVVWGELTESLGQVHGIRRFQLIQRTYDQLVARLVMDRDLAEGDKSMIKEAAQRTLGNQATVSFEFPVEIQPEPSGKYRYQVCDLQPSANKS